MIIPIWVVILAIAATLSLTGWSIWELADRHHQKRVNQEPLRLEKLRKERR